MTSLFILYGPCLLMNRPPLWEDGDILHASGLRNTGWNRCVSYYHTDGVDFPLYQRDDFMCIVEKLYGDVVQIVKIY
jgi:hypothetical protein